MSADSGQRARLVLEQGIPELAARVDRGDVSVTAASTVARLPKAKQRKINALGARSVTFAASNIRRMTGEKSPFLYHEHPFTPKKSKPTAEDVLNCFLEGVMRDITKMISGYRYACDLVGKENAEIVTDALIVARRTIACYLTAPEKGAGLTVVESPHRSSDENSRRA